MRLLIVTYASLLWMLVGCNLGTEETFATVIAPSSTLPEDSAQTDTTNPIIPSLETASSHTPRLDRTPFADVIPGETIPLTTEVWSVIMAGFAQRLYTPEGFLAQMIALRIDPTAYTFRVHYRPEEPLFLDGWRELLPDAVAIVNTNFFNAQNTIEGMLIADGVVYGRAYTQQGGMFTITNQVPSIRVNWLEPYQAGEPIQQATQAFPMLVIDGVQSFTDSRQTRPSRRSVIGLDGDGNVVIMATPAFGLGLVNLSAYLPTTDLNLWRAFNLDGGGSTMLYIAPDVMINSFDPVPAVLAVYPSNP